MMPEYHIGSLDEASRAALADPEPSSSEASSSSEKRPVFLQPKTWSKALLSGKRKISQDTIVFSFTLDHPDQAVGLPVGQHLMMRLRDPVTREAIIRAYTPISEITDRGELQVLIKIYAATSGPGGDDKGGKMTTALSHLPIGHWVDFKGPIGKFEYLGRGRFTLNGGRQRTTRRFIMVCGGSGVTPVFQVLRAVARDPQDPTRCLLLDGNRAEDDILCRAELDALVAESAGRCALVHSLTRPSASWTGRKGRMDRPFFEREVGRPRPPPSPPLDGDGDGGDVVLVCGPESMERSVREIFTRELGWREEDMIFF